MDKWFEFKNAADGVELLIFEEIGGWGVSARDVVNHLALMRGEPVTVRINSLGGDVFDGVAIYNALRAHDGDVTCVVEGIAASAASVIAMGGDVVQMKPGSQLMIHEASAWVDGDADSMKSTAEALDKVSESLAGIYAARAGTPADMWRAAMRVETWFSADEAVGAGLADVVLDDAPVLSNNFDLKIFNYAGRGNSPAPAVKGASMDVLSEIRKRLGVEDDVAGDVLLAALDEALDERAEVTGDENVIRIDIDRFTDSILEDLAKRGYDVTLGDDDGDAVEQDDDVKNVDTADDGIPVEDIEDLVEKVADGVDGLTVQIDKAAFEELQMAAKYGAEAKARDERAAMVAEVDAAIDDGKIVAASRDRFIVRMESDPEGTREVLAKLQKGTVPRAEIGHAVEPEDVDEGVQRASALNDAADKMGLFAGPRY